MIQDDSSNSCDSSVHCRMHWKPLYIAVLQLQSELWALEDALVASGGFMRKWHCCELLMGTMNLHESPIKWTQGQIITFKEMPSNLLPCDSSPILALKVKMLCGFSQKSCNHSRASARNMWRNALSKHQHASTRNVRSEKGQRTQPKLSAANGLAAKTPNSSSCPAECWPRTSASSVATRCAVANRDHNTIQDIQAAQKKDFEVVRQG